MLSSSGLTQQEPPPSLLTISGDAKVMEMVIQPDVSDTQDSELYAHSLKLQTFVQAWVVQQQQLLSCCDFLVPSSAEKMTPTEHPPSGFCVPACYQSVETAQVTPSPAAPLVFDGDVRKSQDSSAVPRQSSQSVKDEDFTRCSLNTTAMYQNSDQRQHVLLLEIVGKHSFELLCACVIFSNAIIIGMATDYAMKHPLNPRSDTYAYFETGFVVFYLMEIMLRICAKGRSYFTDKGERSWNLFDTVIVVTSVWDQVAIASSFDKSASGGSTTTLRLFRLMKMVKLLRVIRVLRMFRTLRLIVSSVFSGVTSLMWAGILIVGISYVFGIAILQGCAMYLELHGSTVDVTTRKAIDRYWSSPGQSMLSLYMSTTGGQDWVHIAKPLLKVGNLFYALFLIYIAIFLFVAVNTISSIFVESMLTHADKDQQFIIETEMQKKEDYIHSLEEFFAMIDGDRDGEITFSEFCAHLHQPQMHAFASSLDIDVTDARRFFEVLSDRGHRAVDIETFVVGCIKMRGPARSVDLVDLSNSWQRGHAANRLVLHDLNSRIADLRTYDQQVLNDFKKLLSDVRRIVITCGTTQLLDEQTDISKFSL